jgi:hypothetical protein
MSNSAPNGCSSKTKPTLCPEFKGFYFQLVTEGGQDCFLATALFVWCTRRSMSPRARGDLSNASGGLGKIPSSYRSTLTSAGSPMRMQKDQSQYRSALIVSYGAKSITAADTSYLSQNGKGLPKLENQISKKAPTFARGQSRDCFVSPTSLKRLSIMGHSSDATLWHSGLPREQKRGSTLSSKANKFDERWILPNCLLLEHCPPQGLYTPANNSWSRAQTARLRHFLDDICWPAPV